MTHSKSVKGMAAMALTALLSSFSNAAFTSISKATIGAGASLTGSGSVSMATTVKDRLSNAAITSGGLTWGQHGTAPAPGAGFLIADQYIQLNTNITTSLAGGIQIYTDNMNPAADPKFTGDRTKNTPAGLISRNDTTKKLPTAWSVAPTTSTVTVGTDPNGTAPTASSWLFHEDASQVAVPSLNATAFAAGDPYVTVYKNGAGLHFGQGPTDFGGFHATDTSYIYTEADFTTATTPNSYETNQLILEAFTL